MFEFRITKKAKTIFSTHIIVGEAEKVKFVEVPNENLNKKIGMVISSYRNGVVIAHRYIKFDDDDGFIIDYV